MRDTDKNALVGTGFTGTTINLAYGNTGTDVRYPQDNSYPAPSLMTSLYTSGVVNKSASQTYIHSLTINMQTFDSNFQSTTPVYYAVRINTQTTVGTTVIFNGNVRLSVIKLG